MIRARMVLKVTGMLTLVTLTLVMTLLNLVLADSARLEQQAHEILLLLHLQKWHCRNVLPSLLYCGCWDPQVYEAGISLAE